MFSEGFNYLVNQSINQSIRFADCGVLYILLNDSIMLSTLHVAYFLCSVVTPWVSPKIWVFYPTLGMGFFMKTLGFYIQWPHCPYG